MPGPPASADAATVDATPEAGHGGYSFRKHLKLELAEYDAAIRRFIPGYETMLGVAASEALARGAARVLDLGAGTGALVQALLDRSDSVSVEAMDLDPEMLALARERLGPRASRVDFRQGSFAGSLPRTEAVTASLALHHVPDLPSKTEVFRRIRDALPEGGVFVNADVTLPWEHGLREAAYQGWADHLVAGGIGRLAAFKHFRDWSDEDTYLPVESELGALREVGFDAHVVWRWSVSTVVVAVRKVS